MFADFDAWMESLRWYQVLIATKPWVSAGAVILLATLCLIDLFRHHPPGAPQC